MLLSKGRAAMRCFCCAWCLLSLFRLWEEWHFMQVRLLSFGDREGMCKQKQGWVILSGSFVRTSRILIWSLNVAAGPRSFCAWKQSCPDTGGQCLLKSILLGAPTFLSTPFYPPRPKGANGLPVYHYSIEEVFLLIFPNVIMRQSGTRDK